MLFTRATLEPIRVLVSGMCPLIASGVEAALAADPSFRVARSGIEPEGLPPVDVVVTDAPTGLRLAHERQLAATRMPARPARIFIINPSNGEHEVRQALEAGAHGYAALDLGLAELQQGVRSVANGLRYVCPRSAQRLADCMSREPLTPREGEVLVQLSRGSCNKTIASELEMALGTVKAHVKALMSKLDARTRTQVVSVAIARGLIEPGTDTRSPAKPSAHPVERDIASRGRRTAWLERESEASTQALA